VFAFYFARWPSLDFNLSLEKPEKPVLLECEFFYAHKDFFTLKGSAPRMAKPSHGWGGLGNGGNRAVDSKFNGNPEEACDTGLT
jgi:hypothetical protein